MTGLSADFRRLPIAHRALHDQANGRPENSCAAIRAAIAAGYGIEIDLQLSRDGVAMVFHDYDLARLTGGKGPIRQRDAAELSQLILAGSNEGIPTLSRVLHLVAGQVPLLIELKDQHGRMGVTDGRLERAVARDLEGYRGPVALMSFNPNSVVELAVLAPKLPRGLVTEHYPQEDWPLLTPEIRAHLRAIPDYERAGACFVSHSIRDLDNPRLAELKAQGADVLCWTVRSPAQERQARLVADNITFENYLADIPS
ncbi:glycerophosphodiester phosphodiesterase family protein [Roseovarius sp. CAU 1744]|uniref:glycerophosphodiester phosphodiesterase family protein n=1 Tax=Roseovarius sp. CAU 1744 TaxID=3140368 RepID=UPI00325AD02C